MQIVEWAKLNNEARRATLTRPAMTNSAEITSIVSNIVNRIRTEGDKALLEFTAKFDKVADSNLRLSEEAIQSACERTAPELKEAIQHAYRNVAIFHEAQKPTALALDTQSGVRCELHYQPINRVGLYVPGGSAPLVSTVRNNFV